MLKNLKLIISFLALIYSFYVIADDSTPQYNRVVGERAYSIASGLFLAEDKHLYVCFKRVPYIRDRDGFSNIIKHPDDQCVSNTDNGFYSCRLSGYDVDSTLSNACYAGWLKINAVSYSEFENKWFSYISKYPNLAKVITSIDLKYSDIFNRLHIAQQHRENLERKFSEYQDNDINYKKYIDEVNSDIRLLSSHGNQLAKVTKRLFKTIKPVVIDAEMRMDTISGRKETMEGLRSFEKEMNEISRLPASAIDDSIKNIIDSIDSAIDDLEKTLAQ